MKLLSFVIPCYNSAEYMRHAIECALTGGEDVEVIIVDDGSTKDNTLEIAQEYEQKYPTIVKAIHKENGGHGSAVNIGLAHASGEFFKVVDSDDWVDLPSYRRILDHLRSFVQSQDEPVMLISNFVYEKVGAPRRKVVHYENALPVGRMFTWDEVGHFRIDQYILMHSVIYRTQLLRDCHLQLPEHTFYVDNIFVFEPLPFVRKLYYLNVNFYRYFIGRSDQSVNEKNMIARIDQQLFVTRTMIDYYLATDIPSRRCASYMVKYLRIMMEISSIFLILDGSPEALKKKDDIWKYLHDADLGLYLAIRTSALGCFVNIPGKGGRKLSTWGYKAANHFFGFN